jgi:hypothetical protein
MDFSPYIATLLYTYDCVIIPQFGGFVANYKPAHIHPVSNKIYPPSKQISFNKNLKHNDGLLANKIAQEKQIPYAKAVELIENWRKEIEKQLTDKGFFTFNKIGTIKQLPNHTILFNPDTKENYFPGAYGLAPVIAKPTDDIKIIGINKKSANYKWLQRAAAIFIGGMITSYLVLNYNNISSQTGQIASFFKTEKTNYIPKNYTFNVENIEHSSFIDSTNYPHRLKLNNKAYIISDVTALKDSTQVVSLEPELRYHIVAGCFSNKSNAKKLVKELKKQGYEPKIISTYKNYYTVIIKSFATKEQAKSFLPQTKSYIAHSWVLEWNV